MGGDAENHQHLMDIQVTGSYTSSVVMLPLARADVARMLPRDLKLLPQTLTPHGTHPVFLSFNEQRRVGLQWGRLDGPRFNYLEFAVGVPYTRLVKPRGPYAGPFFFAPLLYLNELVAIFAGLFWGFAKHDAKIKSSPARFSIQELHPRKALLQANFKLRGEPGELKDFPNARGLTQLLNQPGIGKTIFGPMLSFGLQQNFQDAQVQAMDAQVKITEEFLQGLAPGTYKAQGLDQVSLGAYRMITNWWLDPPIPPSWIGRQRSVRRHAPHSLPVS